MYVMYVCMYVSEYIVSVCACIRSVFTGVLDYYSSVLYVTVP